MSALKANSLNKDLEKCIEPSKKILHSSLNFDLTASTEISKGTIFPCFLNFFRWKEWISEQKKESVKY